MKNDILGIPLGLPKIGKTKPFNFKAFEKAAKDLAKSIDEQYPKYKPSHPFIWRHDWDEKGIEEKLEILYSEMLEIIARLNKGGKGE